MPAQVIVAAAAHVVAVDVAGDGYRAGPSCAGVLRHYRRWQGEYYRQRQAREGGSRGCQVFFGGGGNVSS